MLFESFFFSCGTFFVPRFRFVYHRISVNTCLRTPNRPCAPFVTINIFYSQERLRINRLLQSILLNHTRLLEIFQKQRVPKNTLLLVNYTYLTLNFACQANI